MVLVVMTFGNAKLVTNRRLRKSTLQRKERWLKTEKQDVPGKTINYKEGKENKAKEKNKTKQNMVTSGIVNDEHGNKTIIVVQYFTWVAYDILSITHKHLINNCQWSIAVNDYIWAHNLTIGYIIINLLNL